jgi:hypothetical protein
MRRVKATRPTRRLTGYKTLSELAKELGTSTRRLREQLHAAEQRLGREVMIRNGKDGPGVRHVVTLALLRRHCPELFEPQVEADRAAADALVHLENKIFFMSEKIATQASKIRRQDEALIALAARVSDLEQRQAPAKVA